jgi:hypothetical protein
LFILQCLILTLGTLSSPPLGDGVVIATVGSFEATTALGVAVSATVTFSNPGIDASYNYKC